MTIELDESNPKELRIIKKGNKQKSIFFVILGFIFQVLFVWGYWSFLDVNGPWAYFWLGLINSELFPFLSVLFLFGGGCFIIAFREFGWIEIWIVKEEVFPNTPGIQQHWQFFKWSRDKRISKTQILTLRIHTIPLDRIKLYNRYHIEVDYHVSIDSSLESLVLFSDESDAAAATTIRLAEKIKDILAFSIEIERTEAPFTSIDKKKKKRKRDEKKWLR